jgi:hypothetical protein
VGFGPFLLLATPWVLLAARRWKQLIGRELIFAGVAGLIFYSLWYWIPTNQLTRQLLPVYPLGILLAGVAGTRWSLAAMQRSAWITVLGLCISLGLAIHVSYSVNFLRHYLGGESRGEFLQRNVAFASVAKWVNDNLDDSARVGNPLRSINYLLDVPYVSLYPSYQALVELHPGAQSLPTFVDQLERQRVTHLLVHPSLTSSIQPEFGLLPLARRMMSAGCADLVQRLPTTSVASRTMGIVFPDTVDVLRVSTRSIGCRATLGEP